MTTSTDFFLSFLSSFQGFIRRFTPQAGVVLRASSVATDFRFSSSIQGEEANLPTKILANHIVEKNGMVVPQFLISSFAPARVRDNPSHAPESK